MAFTGHKTVHTEILIEGASSEEVWAVLATSEDYPKWNPIFVKIEGKHAEGTILKYRMRDAEGKESDVEATVVEMSRPKKINQFGGMRGVLTFDHVWRLEQVEGGTRVIQHEEYRGIGVWFWDPGWVEDAYNKANENLKVRVLHLQSSESK